MMIVKKSVLSRRRTYDVYFWSTAKFTVLLDRLL